MDPIQRTTTPVTSGAGLDLASSGPFVLLAGAGLSVWHPSSLPTWTEFNQVLLDEARGRAEGALRAQSPVAAAVRALKLQQIGSKALSNMLVEMLSGERYFDVVNALESERPNDAHRAVAQLAQRGVIAAVVTTNFDTLIERALDEIGVVYTRYSDATDYWSKEQTGLPVFKIHGSAGDTRSLIDTVGQKLRGLAPMVRARLAGLFTTHPVLAVGYSGGDLEFGSDYLGLRSVPAGADRLLWTERPGESTHTDPVLQQLVRSRGRSIQVAQADLFRTLGAGELNPKWNDASRAAVLASLQEQIRDHFRALGPLNALAFCMRLLSATGQSVVAAELWQDIAGRVRSRKRQTAGVVGPAMRALAAEGHRLFGVAEQQEWACRQLRDIHARRTRPRAGTDVNEPAYQRDARSEAHACLVLGETFVRTGRDFEAGVAMERAMEMCELLGDITLLSPVYRLYGWRELVRSKIRLGDAIVASLTDAQVHEAIVTEVTAFGYLQAAEAAGLVGGNVASIDSAWISADFLVHLGEYDAAQICLERLADRSSFGVARETQVRIETLKGEIEVRQGRTARAMDIWRSCLWGPARGNPLLEAYTRHVIVGHAGHAPEYRAVVLYYCDELLSDMDAGRLPADARSDLLGTRYYFETVRRNLTSLGSTPIAPGFIQRLQEHPEARLFWRWPEFYFRQALIEAALPIADDSRTELDLEDALALQWRRPATGEEREKAARALIGQNNFVLGRLMVLEAIAAYSQEGDVRGYHQAFALLRSFATRESRSGESPLSLCDFVSD